MGILNRFIGPLLRRVGISTDFASGEIDFKKLESVLQYSIINKKLFQEAMSHRSYLQLTGKESAVSNERLEFLGDSVLNLVVAEYLFLHRPYAEEGELTKVRSRFVNRKALSIFANQLQLAEFILLSPSALQILGRGKETILSDAFEAVIGAIYIDGGYQEAKKFIERSLHRALELKIIKLEDENFKSQLLELSQAIGLGIPRYQTIGEAGPDHDRTFTVEVYIGKDSYGIGVGKNKKEAEQEAAAQAIQQLNLKENLNAEPDKQ